MSIKNTEGQCYTSELGGILLAKSIDSPDEIKALVTESPQARAIEQGKGYNISCYNTALAIAGVDNFLLTTAASTTLVTLDISRIGCIDTANNKDGSIRIEVFEGTTTSADGTETQRCIANFDRNSSNTLNSSITYAPTITADGTLIFHTIASSSYSSSTELTFQTKPSTKYTIRITNTGGIQEEYAFNLIVFEL